MENDPFASIVECCRITHSAEEILGTCGFAGSDDFDPEECTQPEIHPITMLSLPNTLSQHEPNAEFSTAAKTAPPISNDAGQDVAFNASTGADPRKAVDLGRDKDSSVPMDREMAPEVVSEMEDASTESETETENYRFVKRGAASDDPTGSKLRCDSSEPSVVRGPGKVQTVQNCSIEDDQQLPKTKKFDVLNVLKEIAEHQKSFNSVPKKRNVGLTFPRPKWWPENYEDMV